MLGSNRITVTSDKKRITLNVSTILYVQMKRNIAAIHTISGAVYETRLTLAELERMLGDGFLKVSRGTLVSAMAVHEVGEQIELNNGERLDYAVRSRREIAAQLSARQKTVIRRVHEQEGRDADEHTREQYRCFDTMPIAFADIEMLFDDARRAVDWRFCYANQALAVLENVPLHELIGATFGTLFSNMNVKWLRLYERAVLYHETLEVVDHSPEIDTDLRVICFPTSRGHCGCLLFPVTRLHYTTISPEGNAALLRYLKTLLNSGV